jgi:hypothetical protein
MGWSMEPFNEQWAGLNKALLAKLGQKGPQMAFTKSVTVFVTMYLSFK